MTIVTRTQKGSALTYAEMDNNFTELADDVAGKIDKVVGKGLSTNDYDNTEKQKNSDNASNITAEISARQLADSGLVTQLVDSAPADLNTIGKVAAKLNTIVALVQGNSPDADNIVNTIQELLAVFANYPEGASIADALSGKLNKTDVYAGVDQTVPGKVADATAVKTLTDNLNMLSGLLGTEATNRQNADVLKRDKIVAYYAAQAASFTISADMVDRLVRCTHATVAIVATLPPTAGLFVQGNEFVLRQTGVAQLSALAGAGVNIYSPQGLSALKQHTEMWVRCEGVNLYSIRFLGDDPSKVDSAPGYGLYPATDAVKLNVLSGFKPTDYANSIFFEKANGMYYPVLTAEGLDNPTANATNGLANHASGGVVAAVAGTTGQGNVYLPVPIDPTKPWRAAVLIEINDATAISNLQIGDASANFNTGIKMTAISTTQISGTFGAGTFCQNIGNSSGGIPAGTKIWLGMASDGIDVHAYLIPDATPIYFNFNGVPISAAAYDGRAFSKKISGGYTSNGIKSFGDNAAQSRYRINRLSISTASAQNRIIGVWMNQGLGGPNDGRLQPPAMLTTTIFQDGSACIIIPKKTGYQPVDMVMMNHQNAYNTAGNFNNTGGAGLALAKIYAAGYLVFGIDGVYNGSTPAPNDGTEATNSNWGAATGMKYRKGLWDWVRLNVPGTRKIFLWGWSMGFLNSLRQSIQYPGQISGIIGTSGVCDLTDCITNRGFAATVQKAFSTFYTALVANNALNPSTKATVGAAGAAVGATSIPISALSQALPSGTILNLNTGTGQAQVTLTAAAASGAVALTVTALATAINNGAIYDLSNYWLQLNYGFGQPDELYYKAPYVWRDAWATGTAYAVNDVACVPSAGTVKAFYFVDPLRNVNEFLNIPILIFQGDADTLIPPAQSQSLNAALQGIGGNSTLNIIPGAVHLDPLLFGPTCVTQMINWLNTYTS
jgi:pimeloyl-ACP methyl ester carboxylesterase